MIHRNPPTGDQAEFSSHLFTLTSIATFYRGDIGKAIEYGRGLYSTPVLAAASELTSIECDPAWAAKVAAVVPPTIMAREASLAVDATGFKLAFVDGIPADRCAHVLRHLDAGTETVVAHDTDRQLSRWDTIAAPAAYHIVQHRPDGVPWTTVWTTNHHLASFLLAKPGVASGTRYRLRSDELVGDPATCAAPSHAHLLTLIGRFPRKVTSYSNDPTVLTACRKPHISLTEAFGNQYWDVVPVPAADLVIAATPQQAQRAIAAGRTVIAGGTDDQSWSHVCGTPGTKAWQHRPADGSWTTVWSRSEINLGATVVPGTGPRGTDPLPGDHQRPPEEYALPTLEPSLWAGARSMVQPGRRLRFYVRADASIHLTDSISGRDVEIKPLADLPDGVQIPLPPVVPCHYHKVYINAVGGLGNRLNAVARALADDFKVSWKPSNEAPDLDLIFDHYPAELFNVTGCHQASERRAWGFPGDPAPIKYGKAPQPTTPWKPELASRFFFRDYPGPGAGLTGVLIRTLHPHIPKVDTAALMQRVTALAATEPVLLVSDCDLGQMPPGVTYLCANMGNDTDPRDPVQTLTHWHALRRCRRIFINHPNSTFTSWAQFVDGVPVQLIEELPNA